jgi:hypothetical protein
MKETITCVLENTTGEFEYTSLGRIEALVYISLCKNGKNTGMFTRGRFGVSSDDTVESVLESLCDSGIAVKDVRVTFGGETRLYYRIDSVVFEQSYSNLTKDEIEKVKAVCERFNDFPVSNLHNTASQHSF